MATAAVLACAAAYVAGTHATADATPGHVASTSQGSLRATEASSLRAQPGDRAVPHPGFVQAPDRPNIRDPGLELVARSDLQEAWLQAHGFTPGSVALASLHAMLDGRHSLDARGAKKLLLGPTADAVLPSDGVPRLATQERYVQASLTGVAGTDGSVLVRWYAVGDDSVIQLAAQPVSGNAQEPLQLWRRSIEDWAPGLYRVEVVAANPGLAVLASGDFEIVAPGAAVTPLRYPVQASSAP